MHLPEGKEQFVKLTLKAEYSKTKGRVISLYWRHSADAVKDFLHQRIAEGIRPDEPVYLAKYDAGRQFLNRLGRSVLNRPIHYHLFRHSSATYYANKLNRQELCYRYGWKFSSDMPDVYISRAGMENKQLDEKFTQTEMQELKSKLLEQEQENQRLKEGQQKMLKDYEHVRQELNSFKNLLEKVKKTKPWEAVEPTGNVRPFSKVETGGRRARKLHTSAPHKRQVQEIRIIQCVLTTSS